MARVEYFLYLDPPRSPYCSGGRVLSLTIRSSLSVQEEEQKSWDAEFVRVDQGVLFELILVRMPI